jgi:cyclophilin family peptidyl-prolyl cis-trans isomerase
MVLASAFALLCPATQAADGKVLVLVETSKGNLTLALNADKAPKTVANFLRYVDEGGYNGTIFHRIVPGQLIQGGGYDEDLRSKRTHDPVDNEADNGLSNRRGTIAMARYPDPDSATSQWFINLIDNDYLDHSAKDWVGWGYCVFGEVVEGMDVVDAIGRVATKVSAPFENLPSTAILITRMSRITPPAAIVEPEALKP